MGSILGRPRGDGWTSRWARKKVERAHARDLDTDSRRRALTQTEAERAADRSPATMSWPMRILVAVVAVVVLGVATVIAVVVIGAQVPFYDRNLTVKTVDLADVGIHWALPLAIFTPLATEGLVLGCTLMAVVMVMAKRTAALWTRAMWFFAGVAAFVNTWHMISEMGDVFGGVLRGGLSVANPFLVHLFVLWCQHLHTGKSLTEARADVAVRWDGFRRTAFAVLVRAGSHVAHPVIAIRALRYFLMVPQWSYTDAWLASSIEWRRQVQDRLSSVVSSAPSRADGDGADGADGPVAVEVAGEEFGAGWFRVTSTPAWTEGEAAALAAKLRDPDLTADAFADQRRPPVGEADGPRTARRTETNEEADRPQGRGGRRPPGKAARPRLLKRPVRRGKTDGKADRVDVSDLLPAAREVADELRGRGESVTRDSLCKALRARNLSVGGARKAAIYYAIKSEIDEGGVR